MIRANEAREVVFPKEEVFMEFNEGGGGEGGSGSGRSDRAIETMLAWAALVAARPLPHALVQPVLDMMIAALSRAHPRAFERLAELNDVEVMIDPVDMPLCFVMTLGPRVRLRLRERAPDGDRGASEAAIRGTMAVLLDLFEGRIDGDALFFSRELRIEGDTEAVLVLRNAVDGEDFNLVEDLAGALGPLKRLLPPPVRGAALIGGALADLRKVILLPTLRRLEDLEHRLSRVEQRGNS